MKVSILPENIIKYIPIIGRVLPNHSQLPILSNILLVADKSGLTLKATDLELGTIIKIPAKIDTTGSITVPGKEFLETISAFPKEKIEIEVNKDELEMRSRDNKVVFSTIAATEFPELLKEKGEEAAGFEMERFVNIFSSLVFSTSTEESRPQLMGVFIDVAGGGINFVSTDGYRMSIKKEEKGLLKKEEGLIISTKLIMETLALKGEGSVTLFVNQKENQIVFEAGDVVMVGRMIAGKFPDYQKVLPEKSSTKITFDREELSQAVKLVSVFAKDSSNIVSLRASGEGIIVKTKTQGVGVGEASVSCQTEGDDQEISFNIKYLTDFLKNSTEKELVLKLNSSGEPAVFEDEKHNYTHVIMPIQVD